MSYGCTCNLSTRSCCFVWLIIITHQLSTKANHRYKALLLLPNFQTAIYRIYKEHLNFMIEIDNEVRHLTVPIEHMRYQKLNQGEFYA